MSIDDSGFMPHMVKILDNMTNLQEVKTIVNKGNKKKMVDLL